MADGYKKIVDEDEGIELAVDYPIDIDAYLSRGGEGYCRNSVGASSTWCSMKKGHGGKVHVMHTSRRDMTPETRQTILGWRVNARWFE